MNLTEWWLRTREPHPQSHVTLKLCSHVTNQKYFVFTFTNSKVYKLSTMVTRMRRPHQTCYVSPRSSRHVTTIQLVVYICSTSSWSYLLKKDRFQMIMITLKMCSLYKGNSQGDVLHSNWVFLRKKYGGTSKRNNILLCLYKFCSISPD